MSFYASTDLDGLERVAADQGIDETAEEHGAADSPLAEYGVGGITNTRLSGGLAGVIGVSATVVVGTGVFWVVRRRHDHDPAPHGQDRDAASGPAPDRASGPDRGPAPAPDRDPGPDRAPGHRRDQGDA
ncbi:Putative membrane protein OS=Streptomyces griseus subsp. griseus (strain JCM 4626 / NBRC) OX=455632 GN=SGR_4321 PE=4 SV=1 [Streptomyces griseus subsp. griseus]